VHEHERGSLAVLLVVQGPAPYLEERHPTMVLRPPHMGV
jgi:hypothetical protein